ncbi:IMP dehydrogenase [Halohasta litchfieldiae]|jgi:IMP dehydrogenase|uniref:IMP dehydrogenase n=1 Tax=Halohasta litchfieldiae TaxID=1073996 RepID=A0A1H6TGI6_9EURY|nr:CBS domain-containing protein [Halohasta litchfieldiae]ATW88832.1 IMP dehydrogenase [Halohasta litchfieldiae]SEI79193.1 IMP dehydrogenase [Halohasta litchfieldiae]
MPTEVTHTVEELMSEPIITVSSEITVRDAARTMQDHEINALFVPGAEAGIVTSSDIVAAVAETGDTAELTVADIMTSPVERVPRSLPLGEAAAMMINFDIKHLPVVDDDNDYVGIVSSTDVTMSLA